MSSFLSSAERHVCDSLFCRTPVSVPLQLSPRRSCWLCYLAFVALFIILLLFPACVYWTTIICGVMRNILNFVDDALIELTTFVHNALLHIIINIAIVVVYTLSCSVPHVL